MKYEELIKIVEENTPLKSEDAQTSVDAFLNLVKLQAKDREIRPYDEFKKLFEEEIE